MEFTEEDFIEIRTFEDKVGLVLRRDFFFKESVETELVEETIPEPDPEPVEKVETPIIEPEPEPEKPTPNADKIAEAKRLLEELGKITGEIKEAKKEE